MRVLTTLAGTALLFASLVSARTGPAASGPVDCGAVKGRLSDTASPKGEYVSYGHLYYQLESVNASLHPIVLVEVTNVPCAAGCCTINVFVRPQSTDRHVLNNVIFGAEYQFLQKLPGFQPTAILDAGGNIGLASVLFALRYPDARILTLEPNRGNFELLELNTRRFAKIERERLALWPRNTHLKITDVDKSTRKGEWSFEVREVASGEGDIVGASFEHLMAKHDIESFSMAKIDIEGSEKAVFDAYRHPDTEKLRHWVRSTRLFVLETHDDIAPGALAAVETAMKARGNLVSRFRSEELRVWRFE